MKLQIDRTGFFHGEKGKSSEPPSDRICLLSIDNYFTQL